MAELKKDTVQKSPPILDISKEGGARAVKDYVEVTYLFKGEKEPQIIRGQSLVQIHGRLSQMAEARGLNYTTAFEFHEVTQ